MSSMSPRLRRLSSEGSLVSPSGMDDLVNYYEAEEERIINLLSRKLEKLRQEKISLENALEAESESHVNRLGAELTKLRLQQQQQQAGAANAGSSTAGRSHDHHGMNGYDPRIPSADVVLEALRRENESLRTRLVDLERDHIRMKRLNEVYREELIDHRTRSGSSIDNLLDLNATVNGNQRPYHRRTPSGGSPSSAILTLSPKSNRATSSAPIPLPRPTGSSSTPFPQRHPQSSSAFSSTSSSLTHSPTSTDSPYIFSPSNSHGASYTGNPASYLSNLTTITSPPSSTSLYSNPPMPYGMPPPLLSYPNVPPPSLSSSLGSPIMPIPHGATPDAFDLNNHAHQERRYSAGAHATRRRGSSSARVAETGSLREISESRGRSRRESMERGVIGGGYHVHHDTAPIPEAASSSSSTGYGDDDAGSERAETERSKPMTVRGGSREGTPCPPDH